MYNIYMFVYMYIYINKIKTKLQAFGNVNPLLFSLVI